MFDLVFDVFQVIANVAFLKCSSSFALSYIFMAFKGCACRIYYHLVVQNPIANNVHVNPSVSVSLEKLICMTYLLLLKKMFQNNSRNKQSDIKGNVKAH